MHNCIWPRYRRRKPRDPLAIRLAFDADANLLDRLALHRAGHELAGNARQLESVISTTTKQGERRRAVFRRLPVVPAAFLANRAGRGRDQPLPVAEIRLIRLRVEKSISAISAGAGNEFVIGDRPSCVCRPRCCRSCRDNAHPRLVRSRQSPLHCAISMCLSPRMFGR